LTHLVPSNFSREKNLICRPNYVSFYIIIVSFVIWSWTYTNEYSYLSSGNKTFNHFICNNIICGCSPLWFFHKIVQHSLIVSCLSYPEGPGGSMSWVVGLPNNSYKPITNTAWVRAWLCTSCSPMVGGSLRVLRLFPTTKTCRHDIAEILLKEALNTINQSISELSCKQPLSFQIPSEFNRGIITKYLKYILLSYSIYIEDLHYTPRHSWNTVRYAFKTNQSIYM
jgi:hypothetical protein